MRTILRLFLIVIVVAAGAFFLVGYRTGSPFGRSAESPATVGTSGTVNVERARERGAEIGEKAAVATEKVREAAASATEQVRESTHDGAITAKIKAKMALDDLVKARAIDVSTNGTTVTLSGITASVAEHDRAVALARETDGVAAVVDHLRVSTR